MQEITSALQTERKTCHASVTRARQWQADPGFEDVALERVCTHFVVRMRLTVQICGVACLQWNSSPQSSPVDPHKSLRRRRVVARRKRMGICMMVMR